MKEPTIDRRFGREAFGADPGGYHARGRPIPIGCLRFYASDAISRTALRHSRLGRVRGRRLVSYLIFARSRWSPSSPILAWRPSFYSNINIRPDREAVLAELGRIARDEFRGRVTRNMTTSVYIARRRP